MLAFPRSRTLMENAFGELHRRFLQTAMRVNRFVMVVLYIMMTIKCHNVNKETTNRLVYSSETHQILSRFPTITTSRLFLFVPERGLHHSEDSCKVDSLLTWADFLVADILTDRAEASWR